MQPKDLHAELVAIRSLMERSSKFISLSGLAGVMSGVYALAGARFAFRILSTHAETGSQAEEVPVIISAMITVAMVVILLSFATSYWLTWRKARKRGEKIWNPVSRNLLVSSGIPFFTGGAFAFMLLINAQYHLIPATLLVFYGLALIAGSHYTFAELRWLGICQILLGLTAVYIPGAGLMLWTLGFGLLHIVYGIIMHFKYER